MYKSYLYRTQVLVKFYKYEQRFCYEYIMTDIEQNNKSEVFNKDCSKENLLKWMCIKIVFNYSFKGGFVDLQGWI